LGNELREALSKPGAYPFPDPDIEIKETHISWVFLAGQTAYKVKKPVKFSFLDFSTLEKRKFYCEEEVRLNSRLCPEIYLGIIQITKENERIKFEGTGEVLDYAVKMKRLPEEKRMPLLLKQGSVGKSEIRELAALVAEFHSSIKVIKDKKFSSPEQLREQFNDISSVREAVERELGAGAAIDSLIEKSNAFLEANSTLIRERQENGFIRECHGDLHSGNIFLLGFPVIFDCIEFSEDFRNTDTASDIGFMVMDLDAHSRRDLAEEFTHSYVEKSGDSQLLKLLPWHKLYRANVRAKVSALRLLQGTDETAKKETAKYLELAKGYAELL